MKKFTSSLIVLLMFFFVITNNGVSASVPSGYPTPGTTYNGVTYNDLIVFKNVFGYWSALLVNCSTFSWNNFTCGEKHEYPMVYSFTYQGKLIMGFPDESPTGGMSMGFIYKDGVWKGTDTLPNWYNYWAGGFFPDDTIQNVVYISTLNLVHNDNFDYQESYGGLNITNAPQDIFGVYNPAYPQLVAGLNPQVGGSVTSSPAGISCGTDCQESLFGDVTLIATPSEIWAFGFWDDGITSYTENPKTFTIDQNKTITAKFFKTFRASTGNFYANIGDTGGECVPYVRSETGIPWADFNGDAYTTYQQAINAGYKVSNSIPRVSSVIVFAAQGGMTVGHVAIITAINGNNLTMRDSNWGLDGKVSEHTVDVTNYTILGYIYPTP